MADTLREAGEGVRSSTEVRNAAIIAAAAAGGSLREIAELVGLSHMGVKAIIERQR